MPAELNKRPARLRILCYIERTGATSSRVTELKKLTNQRALAFVAAEVDGLDVADVDAEADVDAPSALRFTPLVEGFGSEKA